MSVVSRSNYPWVKPNRNAPHRCPDCYRVRYELNRGGPRTTVYCPSCEIRWKLLYRLSTWTLWSRRAWRRRNQGIDIYAAMPYRTGARPRR
jgi:hypothetical protein